MMDAIMTADLEIVKTLLPLTDLKSGICLHVAVRYGQLEIFKHLCGLFEDWKNLKAELYIRSFLTKAICMN